MTPSNVYFSKTISPISLLEVFEKMGIVLPGKVAVKISTGEAGGHNYLQPKLIVNLVHHLGGTIVECNTAYAGQRNTVEDHLKVAHDHGFDAITPVDIMDAEGEKQIPVIGGQHLEYDLIGTHLDNYDSLLNLAHFKGHVMGGFGGVLKNQSIGIASRNGKAYIHGAGSTTDPDYVWSHLPEQDAFLESMAEAAKAVADYFAAAGKPIAYINVMNNLSIDCDCDSDPEDPCMADIGIFGSADPVALDQACIDQIWQSQDPGRDHFIERVESRHGRHILPYAESLGLGTREYQLVEVN